MTDEQKDALPNLWVRPDENWDENKHPSVRYSDRKYFDDDVLYVPADRIRELIAKDWESEKDFASSYVDLIAGLESIISEGEAR